MRKSAIFAAVIIAGCIDRNPVTPLQEAPNASISDAVHEFGNAHFFFLPPIVPMPAYSGSFDASLSPVVQVCEWASTGCVMPLIAVFTSTPGAGSETVRLDPVNELYIVNWHTDQFAVESGRTYRMRVLVAGVELGHADVVVVGSSKDVQNVATGHFVPLVDGRTLPIKFRIEEGALGVVIDATALSAPEVRITGVDVAFATHEPFAVRLAPGHYFISYQTAGGGDHLTGPAVAYATADFAIASDGTIDYDASLDEVLSGRGTTTLTVNGVTLTVDMRALSAPTVGIGGLGGGEPFPTARIHTITLLPGLHPIYYQTAGGCTPLTGPCVAFTDAFVAATRAGTVDYDAALDDLFSGRGTAALRVNGIRLSIDLSSLSPPTVGIGGLGGGEPFTTDRLYTFTLLPGLHPIYYQTAGGCTPLTGPCVAFTDAFFLVTVPGTVDYQPALDGIFAGRGTTELTVRGITVDIDLRGLSAPTVGIGGLGGGQPFTTDQVYTFTLLPGLHPIYYQTAGGCTPVTGPCVAFTDAFFMVTVVGTVDYAAALDDIFAGRGTTALTVNGITINVDLSALSPPVVGIGGLAGPLGGNVGFTTDRVYSLRVLPGLHPIFYQTSASPAAYTDAFFKVTVNGTLDFDPSLDAILAGRGTSTLTVDGADITINATGLDETSFQLGGVGELPTGIIQILKLLPGRHRFSTTGDEDFFFDVLVGESLDFDGLLNSFVSGRGTRTLTVIE